LKNKKIKKEYDSGFLPAIGHAVMGSVGDGSFIGPDAMMKGNSRKPVYKTPKSSIHYKKGRFPNEPDFYDENNWETDKPGPSTNVAGKISYVDDRSVPDNSIHKGKRPNENRKNTQTMERIEMSNIKDNPIDINLKIDDGLLGKIRFILKHYGYKIDDEYEKDNKYYFNVFSNSKYAGIIKLRNLVEKIANKFKLNFGFDSNRDILFYFYEDSLDELKDYDDSVVPKNSIHYGERDKVNSQLKLKHENEKPIDLFSVNNNKYEEPISLHKMKLGPTPKFPFSNEDGIFYPVPGENTVAFKSIFSGDWKFNDDMDFDSIEIPCSNKNIIKKMLFYIKERNKLNENKKYISLGNKKIKLNTIYEGNKRKFKTYLSHNGKILEIHFGPKKGKGCDLK